jgi:hypothetical protein
MLEEGAGKRISGFARLNQLTYLFSVSENRWEEMHFLTGLAGVCK